MTLNTFHFAGIGSKSNVTRGVPRLKELLHISKNIKKPSITIYLKDEFKYNRVKAQEIANKIGLTVLKDLVLSTTIYYDPKDNDTLIEDDTPFMDVYKVFNDVSPIGDSNDSNWVLRLEIDRKN